MTSSQPSQQKAKKSLGLAQKQHLPTGLADFCHLMAPSYKTTELVALTLVFCSMFHMLLRETLSLQDNNVTALTVMIIYLD